MVVQNQTKKVTGSGNDVATSFSFSPMVILKSADLTVVHVDANGDETTLTEGSHYTVVVSSYPGTGSITYPITGSPLPTGEKLIMKRLLVLEQQTDLNNQGGYFADVQETAFDRLTMIALQLEEVLDRSLTLPIGVAGVSLELPSPVADRAIGWNATADALVNIGSLGAVTTPVAVGDGGTGASSAANARTNLGVPGLSDSNTFTQLATFQATVVVDTTGSAGNLNVGSNLASGTVANINLRGHDDAAGDTTYFQMRAAIDDPSAGVEDGHGVLAAIVGGLVTDQLGIGNGLYTPNATGGAKGQDSLNISAVYIDNVLLDPASQAEMETATDTTIGAVVTPGRVKNSPHVVKVAGSVDRSAGTPSLNSGSVGVSSVSDGGAGETTINFSTSFSSAVFFPGGTPISTNNASIAATSLATGSVLYRLFTDSNTALDTDDFAFMIMGDQ